MKKLAGIIGVALALCFTASTAVAKADDLLPWPWGSECPFPWSSIEGQWEIKDHGTNERFVFQIKGIWEDGTRNLEVRRYDSTGALIGRGQGLAPRGERIVRAAMNGVGREEGLTYWAFLRTYTEKVKASCSRAKQVTVLTIRPVGEERGEVHFILEKVDDGTRAKKP